MIRAVTFDGDDTLWDFKAGMVRSLAAVLAELQTRLPGAYALTVERLVDIRDEVAGEMAEPGLRPSKNFLEEVRRAAFVRTLESIGAPDPNLADHLNRLYFEHRWAPIEVFPDARPALNELKARYTLGLITNGNSKVESAGLGGIFDFLIYADDHGVEKPDAKLFREALRMSSCESRDLVHVGDSLLNDVGGAQALGIKGVWLNRMGLQNESEIRPDAEIMSLLELPKLVSASIRS